MNNVGTGVIGIVASASALLIGGHFESQTRLRNHETLTRSEVLESERDHLLEVFQAARLELEHRRADFRDAMNALNTPASSAAGETQFSPEEEGIWPTNRAYFYMPKEMLRSASFERFERGEAGLRLHSNTAVVLGMAAEQAVRIDRGFEALTTRFKELERETLKPSEIHVSDDWPAGAKRSYRIPALKEVMGPYTAEFINSARSILEPSQADILEEWAMSAIRESLLDFGANPRLITLTDEHIGEGRTLTRFELAEEGGTYRYYFELWNPPIEVWPSEFPEELKATFRTSFPYRHLFGDNGEVRP